MSDTNDSGENKSNEGKKTLSLKRGAGGTVRQSFSHGRTNTVVVEKKRRRFAAPGASSAPEAAPVVETRIAKPKVANSAARRNAAAKPAAPATPGSTGGAILRHLSDDEQEARAKALAFAREREEERRLQELAEEKARNERAEAERLDAEKRKAEEERLKKEEEARLAQEKARAEEEASKVAMATEGNPAARTQKRPPEKRVPEKRSANEHDEREERSENNKGGLKAYERPKAEDPKPSRRTEERKRGKLTLSNALDDGQRERSLHQSDASANVTKRALPQRPHGKKSRAMS